MCISIYISIMHKRERVRERERESHKCCMIECLQYNQYVINN